MDFDGSTNDGMCFILAKLQNNTSLYDGYSVNLPTQGLGLKFPASLSVKTSISLNSPRGPSQSSRNANIWRRVLKVYSITYIFSDLNRARIDMVNLQSGKQNQWWSDGP
jgi:hypothetical protein